MPRRAPSISAPMSRGRRATQACAGFTLVELLIVTLLFILIGGGLLMAFLTGQTSYLTADASIQVQEEARRAFDFMVRELREANTPTCTGSCTGTQQLDFQVALGYNSPDVTCGGICWGGFDVNNVAWRNWTIRYRIDATKPGNPQLVREVRDAGGTVRFTRVLANTIDTDPARTFFAYDAANRVVTMNLRILLSSALIPGGQVTSGAGSLTSQVKLRNP